MEQYILFDGWMHCVLYKVEMYTAHIKQPMGWFSRLSESEFV